jgi:hypothetical protein
MIALLANKWFAGAAVALALIIGAYIWLGIHDRSQQAIGEARCQAKMAQALAQAKQEQEAAQAAYSAKMEGINAQYQQELAAISGRVVYRPIWLHDGQVCAGTMPSAPTAAGDQPAGAGGAVGGDGENIRPAVEAFKGRLETLVAQCRRMAEAWPK